MELRDLSWEVLLVFGGVQTVLTTLVGYLGKLWFERNLQSEKAKLEALLQKSVYVEKVQFDTEFKIYSELWKGVCLVREAIFAAQRKFDEEDRRISTQREIEMLQQLDSRVQEFKGLVEHNRPFFAADIAALCVGLLGSTEELKEMQISESRPIEPTGKGLLIDAFATGVSRGLRGREFLRGLTVKTDEICEAIRARLTGSRIT
jgi:hypothetical protein